MTGMVTSKDYEGLPLDAALKKAISHGLNPRVVEQDGKSFMLTMEVVSHRVNFRVRDGLVIEAYAG